MTRLCVTTSMALTKVLEGLSPIIQGPEDLYPPVPLIASTPAMGPTEDPLMASKLVQMQHGCNSRSNPISLRNQQEKVFTCYNQSITTGRFAPSNAQIPTQDYKHHGIKTNMTAPKKTNKAPETDLKEMEICNLSDKEFKVIF